MKSGKALLITIMGFVVVLTCGFGRQATINRLEQVTPDFLEQKVPERNYEEGTQGTFAAVFGWDGDRDAAIAYDNGSFLIRDGKNIIVGFGIAHYPGSLKWYNHSGYLPCLVTEFKSGQFYFKIMNFADKVTLGGNDYVIAYSRVSATNRGTQAGEIDPGPSASFISLNSPDHRVNPSDTVHFDYAVAIDRFGNDYPWPADEEIKRAGGWDEHFSRMKVYWDGKLSKITQIKTPDNELNNAYKAGYIYSHIVKDGISTHVGENGYDRVYDHDATGILATLLTIGDLTDAKPLLDVLPVGKQYDDATWKYAWPWALYLLKTDDVDFARAHWATIKEAAHKISDDRQGPDGIMKMTSDIDANGYWTVDNWSGLTGLLAYRYVAGRLGETEEKAWAEAEYNDFLMKVNNKLSETIQKYRLNYIPTSMVEPNEKNRTRDPKDANWAASFFFGRWAWDGWLLGGEQRGPGLEMIDATYDYGFKRLKDAGLPPHTYGGYPNPDFEVYSTAYNTGYAGAALRGNKYRAEGIRDYQFMIANTQSGPFSWWENIGVPAPSAWFGIHPGRGGGSSPHMWGQSSATKVFLESIAAEFYDGRVLIGRGIPEEWLGKGKIEVKNIPISRNRRLDVTIHSVSPNRVLFQFGGGLPLGDIILNLPVFLNRIQSATAGKVDKMAGTITVPANTRSVTVVLNSADK